VTCANCVEKAVYYVDSQVANAVAYCRDHLPKHLQVQADLGQFDLPAPAPAKK
jgi:hypothetical protein